MGLVPRANRSAMNTSREKAERRALACDERRAMEPLCPVSHATRVRQMGGAGVGGDGEGGAA